MVDNKILTVKLVRWYQNQKRPLPWREDRDPYKIWISEIMLQQTTSTAVIGFFSKFLKRFPNVKALSEASIESVYEMWAGLGYYSRARNIHKTALEIATSGFPTTYMDLIELPGIGPYASRAISSQAFGERVGVVDGNVNRVYCRMFNDNSNWWTTLSQKRIQLWVDTLVVHEDPSDFNQALMELGATICTPRSPACLVCPWSEHCIAFKKQSQSEVPVKKPKRVKEIWVWSPDIYLNSKNEILIVEGQDAPFLKDKWVFPGKATLKKVRPKGYTYKHNITHHEIYVCLNKLNSEPKVIGAKTKYTCLKGLKQISPFSLVSKALDYI